MARPSRSLSAQLAARRLEKRERLSSQLSEGRRGPGHRRTFKFKVLPFDSDPERFDRNGGLSARTPLTFGKYTVGNKQIECRNLTAPRNFSLRANPDGVLRFVYELRRQVFIERAFGGEPAPGRPDIYINLDEINKLDLPASLILTAELDRVRRVLGIRPVLDDHRWDEEIRNTFYSLGLHNVVEARRRDRSVPIKKSASLSADRFQIIPMRSGSSSSNDLARAIRDELYEACKPFSAARPQFYNVLVEAFNNTREHAYPEGSGEDGIPSVGGWWAGAIVDHQLGLFELTVYDQGIGIPERFSRQHPEATQERLQVGGSGDMLVLQRAAEHGASSSGEPGRGNGLWQMTDLTRSIPESEVQFISLCGSVAYRNGIMNRAFIPPQRFCGTMILWTVPFRLSVSA